MEERPDRSSATPPVPRGWARHPAERMLITPIMAGVGGLIAFFIVVAIVVWLPIHTFDPPPSADWAPLSNVAWQGRNLFASNNCYVCHSGYSRPQDVRYQLYFLYPKVSQPTAFVEQRSGKSGLLRYAGQLFAKHIVLLNQGFPAPYQGFQGAHKPIVESNDKSLKPPKGQLEEAPNLSQIDRSYWLSSDPLPVTEANLLRGKEIFLDRCVACHGLSGNGKGPGARFMSPPPADFTSADDACCGGDTGPGDFYYRILHGWPGTGMENFGERLSVDDIWRVVLFVKTIPNGTLKKNIVPEPKDFITWQPSAELLAWLKSRQKLTDNPSFSKKPATDPFMQEAMRLFPGLSPADSFLINDGKTRLSLKDAAAGIKAIYDQLLNTAWSEARARGEKLPPLAQKDLAPTVPGMQ